LYEWPTILSEQPLADKRVFRPERPNFPYADVWTARLSKLETRQERGRINISNSIKRDIE
jgi:hypothetical protein